MDLDALAAFEIDAGLARRLVNAVLASDEDGRAETLVDEGDRGADHLLLLALGEDHALRELAHALEDAVERAGDRIAPRRELRLVGAHVDDRPARDAGIHGGLAPPPSGSCG